MPLRIFLLDGQRIVRHGLRALFAGHKDLAVVGDTAAPGEALALIEVARPHVLITDLCSGTGSRLQHIEQIHARFPTVAILVVTELRAREVATQVRRAGAHGYLLYEQGFDELLVALREVAAGRRYRCHAANVGARRAAREGAEGPGAVELTVRQRQVLQWVALGYRAREIAAKLGVSVRAVYRQRERLRDALQLHSTAALTRFAAREGLTEESVAQR